MPAPAGAATAAAASAAAPAAAKAPRSPRFALYGQATYTQQGTDGFHAPYGGANSLSPRSARETADVTLFLGLRPWRDGELWVDPEIDQGFGLDDTVGLAGFSSGEAYKVGSRAPYFRLQRAFLRQTIPLGGGAGEVDGADELEPGPNQFSEPLRPDRLVLTAGKLSVVDIFDVNRYAHDPRADFLNWSLIDAGTFDYAANAWGYSEGGAAEWYAGDWATRAGLFDLSVVPNSPTLDAGFDQYQMDVELEHRHRLFGQSGKLDVTGFESRGRMALLTQAIAAGELHGGPPQLAAVRQYRKRDGVSLNLEQSLGAELGAFVRAGSASGDVETYEFTDIDRTLSGGLSLRGQSWHRAGDTLGIGGAINALSRARRQYLNAGGLGVLVGDGRLPHAGNEQILEAYYAAAVSSLLAVTVDAQWVQNPAYNRDRGPVAIGAVRLHLAW